MTDLTLLMLWLCLSGVLVYANLEMELSSCIAYS